ncbi:hypothetical protein LOTGIDRAFT_173057 [Lottia gigantea]|uniref:DNA-directed DNA polymerase n=1 Tax=Lottia gigantea TaxID=225164 RepID=V4A9W6_LOTGI|nr:hypothetical protein LOTGIDRAFT_173057 [Lottia gigantea]ESP00789.1 hypothetical protein LOTGIDRAFT_173057 [Lottia gigantea]
MTCARINEFNKTFKTSFQILNPKNRHLHPRDVHDELDWVFYFKCPLIMQREKITSDKNYLQNISFTCSYQHEKSSLAAWGNSSNLPANLRKIADVDIAKYTQDNWEELRHEWEPYAKRDTLCLGACIEKYNQAMKDVVIQNMSNNLTAPSLSLKGWYYLYHYDKEMVEEEHYETTRMLQKHTEKPHLWNEATLKLIDGFYKPEIYYTDTDSLYISSNNWKKLKRAGLVSEKDYCKGKNDYGDGGNIFGLYLEPKVKYNIILTSDGVLKEKKTFKGYKKTFKGYKKTFKGYSNDKISEEDYIQLASGHDVSNEFKKPWEKNFANGVVIPKDDDKQTKVFRSYLNNVKRKPPNSEGIMYPYNDKDEYTLDENCEFDDFDYLTIKEENEELFDLF